MKFVRVCWIEYINRGLSNAIMEWILNNHWIFVFSALDVEHKWDQFDMCAPLSLPHPHILTVSAARPNSFQCEFAYSFF